VRISWTHASRRHWVARSDARFVAEHCGAGLAPSGVQVSDDRLLHLGDDPSGTALEVVSVEMEVDTDEEYLRVMHVMELRSKYRDRYEEGKQWRV
jgi:hypothetical protein